MPIADIARSLFDDLIGTGSNVGGTAMPIAFAVVIFIASSYFVGVCTGRSGRFSPRNIRSTYDAALRYSSVGSRP